MSNKSFQSFGAALVICLVVGCQQTPPPTSPEIRNYVLAVDSNGVAGDPVIQTQTAKANPAYDLDAQLDGMFAAMDAEHARIAETRRRATTAGVATTRPVRKVLIFAHGGLNEPAEALKRAVIEHHEIAESGSGAYAIFLNWNSGFTSSYGEHLVDVRRGRNDHKDVIAGPAMTPLVFFADFAMAVGRAPLLWVYQVDRDLQTGASDLALLAEKEGAPQPWLQHPRHDDAVRMTDALRKKFAADPTHEIQISTGDENVNSGELTWLAVRYFAMLPFKFLTSPLLDGAGTPAWDNMSRRTQIMFEGSALNESPGSNHPDAVLNHPPGAVQHFADRLAAHIDANHDKYSYEITLVGHSMGSMVLNEFVRRNPKLPYTNIVYMAAACTVRDFSTSVVPLMRRNRGVKFYNLCLHPTADLRETHGYEFPPRGSLLVWIDDYFANPSTPLDRTLGRWENIVESTYVIPDDPQIKKRITLKAFALNEKDAFDPQNPQQHGHFRYLEYWDEDMWRAKRNEEMEKAIARHADRIEQARQQRAPRTKERESPVQQYKIPATTQAAE